MALSFRQRIFAWLLVVSVVPAAVAVAVMLISPEVPYAAGGVAAWERAANSWRETRRALDPAQLTPAARRALDLHSGELSLSLRRARQARAIREAFAGILAAAAVALAVLVAGGTVRLAGHLSRQLSRPIDELVWWTQRLQRGERLPDEPPARGAPEFELLRAAFRSMAGELERSRAREVEAAQLRAFREMARQVAHELKNPLTPIRFAVSRLARDAPPEQRDLVTVLEAESGRLERMARDFAELGRLPEGPTAPIDVAELLDSLATAAPEGVRVTAATAPQTPRITGHYELLRRALQNLVLNAIEAVASSGSGDVMLGARASGNGTTPAVEITVRDTGPGIPTADIGHIFEPYFTTKPTGTGLGLAIVRQTIHHEGGTISVDSAPGRGTVFTLLLPAERT